MQQISEAINVLENKALQGTLTSQEQTAIAHLIAAQCAIEDASAKVMRSPSATKAEATLLLNSLKDSRKLAYAHSMLLGMATDKDFPLPEYIA